MAVRSVTLAAGETKKVEVKGSIAFSIECTGDNAIYFNQNEGGTETTVEILPNDTRVFGEIVDSVYAEDFYLYAASASKAVIIIYNETV